MNLLNLHVYHVINGINVAILIFTGMHLFTCISFDIFFYFETRKKIYTCTFHRKPGMTIVSCITPHVRIQNIIKTRSFRGVLPLCAHQGSALDTLGASRRPQYLLPFFEYSKLKPSYATACVSTS